jgi:DNA-binding response OmpR family regulator
MTNLPVIAVTANPSLETEAALKAAGADLMMAKPVDLAGLAIAIAGLLSPKDDAAPAASGPVIAPPGALYDHLLLLAREGNLRALRKELPAILALGPQYKPFADRLDALASAYQSPAVLRLIESSAPDAAAA